MEAASLLMGGPRIKFACVRAGEMPHLGDETLHLLRCLSRAMSVMERLGGAPVLPDGMVGGNCALRVSPELLLVSRSGKQGGVALRVPEDFVAVTAFDEAAWSCTFASSEPQLRPSSDTPLLWRCARVTALHGHGIDTEEDAHKLQCPISPKETLFSTAEDAAALAELIQSHPTAPLLLRKGHGFFLLSDSEAGLRQGLAPIEALLRSKLVCVFVVGFGGVGRVLCRLLAKQTLRRFVVAGVSDSRGWCWNEEGINVEEAIALKEQGKCVAAMSGGSTSELSSSDLASCDVVFDARPFDMQNRAVELFLDLMGKHGVAVVFTNKAPAALSFSLLTEAAQKGKTSFRFSSCVGGALPSVNILARDLRGCRVSRIEAVLNVSSNMVLKTMESDGVTLDEVCVAMAKRGLLETDPSMDIDGWDSAAKLAILANVMGFPLTLHDIKRTGIRHLQRSDLLASIDRGERMVLLCLIDVAAAVFSVAPASLPAAHPLARLGGDEMGIRFVTDISGEVFASCVHVDASPTAAAMIRDAYDVLRQKSGQMKLYL